MQGIKRMEFIKMTELSTIKGLIEEGKIDIAIDALNELIKLHPVCDEAYYLRGNAYRKQGNWQLAINSYLAAIEINPESPAQQANKMMTDILNFYNKDMFNQ